MRHRLLALSTVTSAPLQSAPHADRDLRDPLTGLPNHATAHRMIRDLVEALTPFSLALCNIDGFGEFNTRHGRDGGDLALRTLTSVLGETLRPDDIVCRYGGDTFLAVFPKCSTMNAAAAMERVRESLVLHIAETGEPAFTCSSGVADSNQGTSIDELLGSADLAMSMAKYEGGNRVRTAVFEVDINPRSTAPSTSTSRHRFRTSGPFGRGTTLDATMSSPTPLPNRAVPEKPSLDGLEATWGARWEAEGTYRFDRTAERADVFSIDTPPPTASGSLHIGHVFSYTHTDTVARYQRMAGKSVFYPMGWDDNGLPTERRVENYYGILCDPTLPYVDGYEPPEKPRQGAPRLPAISRRNFIEMCERLTETDEQVFEELFRRLGLSVDWRHSTRPSATDSQRTSQRAFLRNLARGEAYSADAPSLWDITFRMAVSQAELEDRERPAPTTTSPSTGPTAPTSSSPPPGPSCSSAASRSSPTPTTPATSRCSAPPSPRRSSASRSRSSPTTWPSPTRAPASP